MKLNVTQKILAGYLVGFVLLLAFAGLTLINGKRIQATTVELSQQKLPGLIAASALKIGLQEQTKHLYELYATNDRATFQKRRAEDADYAATQWTALQKLPEFKSYEQPLSQMVAKQSEVTDTFVSVMRQPEVDWDHARDVLSQFSLGADGISGELDKLVSAVTKQTLDKAANSQVLTEQLMNVGLVLALLIFLGVLAMAYYAHARVAQPLRQVSETLRDIATRRDLTRRLNHGSDDEIGDIAQAGNNLLEEFQKLALTLDGTAQEVNRTMSKLTEVTESARVGMGERNNNLRSATQAFMQEIEAATRTDAQKIDPHIYRAQMKFIQTHLSEIDSGTVATETNVKNLQNSTTKLKDLAENMRTQIRLLNF